MNEKKLIQRFSLYGFQVEQIAGKYYVYDRRNAQPKAVVEDSQQLLKIAEAMNFETVEGILQTTIHDIRAYLEPEA